MFLSVDHAAISSRSMIVQFHAAISSRNTPFTRGFTARRKSEQFRACCAPMAVHY